jgi:hypothetical protein
MSFSHMATGPDTRKVLAAGVEKAQRELAAARDACQTACDEYQFGDGTEDALADARAELRRCSAELETALALCDEHVITHSDRPFLMPRGA